ncbi:MAG: cobalamin-binding protein [Verrucomicrobiota bacterium]|nr:cobalamin-binding protein [Verrucomicrobiota bacterium]
MSTVPFYGLVFIIALFGSATCALAAEDTFPITVTDALKRSVTIQKKPQRIISLIPSVTETLFAIEAGGQIIAVTPYCDTPKDAKKLPKVGAYVDPDLETIVALKPDVIFTGRGNRTEMIESMERSGIRVIKMESKSYSEAVADIRLAGKVTGTSEKAEALAHDLEKRKVEVLQRYINFSDHNRPRVLFLFSLDNLYTVGPGSHIHEMIELAGGKNIAAEARFSWAEIQLEKIVSDNPDVILLTATNEAGKKPVDKKTLLNRLRNDPQWRNVDAVKTGRIFLLDANLVSRPGPRIALALETMESFIHNRKGNE